MRTLSDGAIALAEQGTGAAIARALGVTKQAVSKWILGISYPSREHLMEIEQLFGIPTAWWYTFTRRARAQRASVRP